jgi:hypothetical protein
MRPRAETGCGPSAQQRSRPAWIGGSGPRLRWLVAHGGPQCRMAMPGQRSHSGTRAPTTLNNRNGCALAVALRRAIRRVTESLTGDRTTTSAGGFAR